LVDEVLAVGDAQFQKKCLGKMEDVANKQGKTILFVSHNMAAIQALCSRAIFIQRGKIALDTDVAKATQSYSDSMQEESVPLLSNERNRDGSGTFRFKSVQIKDAESNSLNVVRCGRDVDVILEYESRDNQPLKYVQFAIGFHSLLGQFLFMCTTDLMNMDFPILPPKGQVVCRIPFFPLSPGRYGFNFNGSANGILADWVKDLLCFSVIEDDFFGSGKLPPQTHGGFLVRHSWMEGPASLSP
ncbi:MAG: ABC transporter ATP-binding protein, partial [Candidatus Aureabacteria bacterium]|nr:ABC transporter ATP-binding protein [Candidatus Auribacterota bacterium]